MPSALRFCTLVVCLILLPKLATAQPQSVYQRNRISAATGSAWPVNAPQHWYGGWYAPQFYAGSWYQRPYPYHFDYYRWRYQSPPAVSPECPCEVDQ